MLARRLATNRFRIQMTHQFARSHANRSEEAIQKEGEKETNMAPMNARAQILIN